MLFQGYNILQLYYKIIAIILQDYCSVFTSLFKFSKFLILNDLQSGCLIIMQWFLEFEIYFGIGNIRVYAEYYCISVQYSKVLSKPENGIDFSWSGVYELWNSVNLLNILRILHKYIGGLQLGSDIIGIHVQCIHYLKLALKLT